MLQVDNVHKVFNSKTANEKHVLQGIDLSLQAGDFVTVIGGNGAGKSTLLNCVAGSLKVNKGTISLDGEEIQKQPEEVRAQSIARVFQDPLKGTAPRMTVAENLALAYRRGESRLFKRVLNKDLYSYFHDLLKEVGLNLEGRLDDEVGNLSGGQRQTIAMVMATLKPPKLLLLDEHVAALDPKASETVMDLTRQRVAEGNLTTMMITHNMNHAIQYGNRLIMMDKGRIIYDVAGGEKADLTVDKLLEKFKELGSEEALTDKMILEA